MKRWPTKSLGDVLEISRERIEPIEHPGKPFNYVGLESIEGHTGRILPYQPTPGAKIKSTKNVFYRNEILYGKLRPYLNKVHLASEEGICSTDIYVLRPRQQQIHPAFAANYLRSPSVLAVVSSAMAGANLPRIGQEALLEISVPVPPLTEQERIVKLLDETDELRKLRAQADRRTTNLASALFYEFFGEPVANTKGFPRKTLGELIEFIGGSQPPRSTFSYEPTSDKIRLVQIRDFKSDEHKTYIPKSLARRFFKEDDVMIGRYGPPLFQILRGLSGSYNVALIKAVPKSEVMKDFVFHLLSEKNLHSTVIANSERTAGQTGVKLDLLEEYPAFLPPLSLQKEFAKRVTEIRELEARQAASRTHLDALFQSMLHRAFNGEL
jgi:type I restriction enzyme S subunit